MTKKPNPQDDASSIGNILLSMGVISEAQLWDVLVEQQKLREDQLLGKLLVASGIVSVAQLEQAMTMQKAMRSKKPAEAALANADVAIARHRRNSVIAMRERIERKSHAIVRETTRRITSQDHPAVGPMLAKSEGD